MLLPMLAALATINTFIYVFKVITKKEEEENKEKKEKRQSAASQESNFLVLKYCFLRI